METSGPGGQITDEWVEQHFDHLSPELAREFHPTLVRIAQDWRTFSSELGITVPAPPVSMKILPVTIDPPLQRTFKRLLNAHFTPAKVAPWTEPTRQLVNHLIDGFIERGECDFMTDFARPFPGLAFFDQALHAPADDLEEVNHYATMASLTHLEESFTAPDAFDLDRPTNRHIAFGAGPHRCVGSNLARMNLRIALEEIVRRLNDLKLQPGADIDYHSTFNRAPLSVPITFTPGERAG